MICQWWFPSLFVSSEKLRLYQKREQRKSHVAQNFTVRVHVKLPHRIVVSVKTLNLCCRKGLVGDPSCFLSVSLNFSIMFIFDPLSKPFYVHKFLEAKILEIMWIFPVELTYCFSKISLDFIDNYLQFKLPVGIYDMSWIFLYFIVCCSPLTKKIFTKCTWSRIFRFQFLSLKFKVILFLGYCYAKQFESHNMFSLSQHCHRGTALFCFVFVQLQQYVFLLIEDKV